MSELTKEQRNRIDEARWWQKIQRFNGWIGSLTNDQILAYREGRLKPPA